MSRIRLLPLLLATTALALTASGCGGDDEPAPAAVTTPPAATQAQVPAATTPPATTTEDAPAPTTTEDAPPKADSAPDRAKTQASKPSAAKNPLDALKNYTKGGAPASAADTAEVRDAFRTFGEAVGKHDAKTACARVIGFDELLRASGQKATSCEDVFKGTGKGAAGPSKEDLAQIAKAQVTIKGDRATLLVTGQSPMPMRKDGGVWKIDYSAFGNLASGGKK